MNKIFNLDAREGLSILSAGSCQVCVTSPPYYMLRDYDHPDQIGIEETPAEYIRRLVAVFDEVWRVLKDDGTLWVVIADTYNGYNANSSAGENSINTGGRPDHPKGLTDKSLKNKDLLGIPWRLAFALQESGWFWRQEIVWQKPNPTPERVHDRCTRSHEHILMFSKKARYFYDKSAIEERALSAGSEPEFRNKRSVWTAVNNGTKEAHFASYPPELVAPCIKAGSEEGDLVLDPFFGTGATGEAALRLNRKFVGIEINPKYIEIADRRLAKYLQNLFA